MSGLLAYIDAGAVTSYKEQYYTMYAICLEEIAKAFEIDVVYDEKQVNSKIEAFYEDYCTIRCDMISEGIMIREGTSYVRKK